ncbi:MAG: bifunctional [glutamine synthetase] adenylyltransferase/[glutamine synthetase]-adenylyl-L-tyrosine phosphorylase [Actinobacteria bacterium]|nr:bifunctional [glutamine synthetase] adenylyltransferase/[glutamine synthetase]-adenylyl-L-tyrosine phosphorylase [Actinomycetota bacterium]
MTTRSVSAARRACVAAASRTLGDLLAQDAAAGALLENEGQLPDHDGYATIVEAAVAAARLPGLRAEKRRRLLEIAARDLTGEAPLEVVTRALADLADACLDVALRHLGAPPDLAVIALGKLGGRELNYVSDIDLTFATTGDVGLATKAAAALIRAIGEPSAEGQVFTIDLALRPEGRSGALVRSVDAYLEYYKKWAGSWEFQAFIKARHAAGSSATAATLLEAVTPLVFAPEVSSERIGNIRKMKERLEAHVAGRAGPDRRGNGRPRPASDDVKLGPGGIRDIEFSVQLLQLVHGGADPNVRSANTLDALRALAESGYVAEDDGDSLAEAYRWLRSVEHRLQLRSERRTHRLPAKSDDLAQLARGMGLANSPERSAEDAFRTAHRAVLVDVRTRFEKLFYRPMIESLAAEPAPNVRGPAARLSEEALGDRLRVLGFRDVSRAAVTLGRLVVGSSRRARVLRVLTPAMLRFLASAPLPDAGLASFLRLGETLEDRPDVLGRFRDNPPGLAFLAAVLGSGRWPGAVLAQVPEELKTVADVGRSAGGPGIAGGGRQRVVAEAVKSLEWRVPEGRLDGLRRFKRREMLRIALADLAGQASIDEVGAALAELAEGCLEAALQGSEDGFAVIGMGKLGGRELNYASDIDVMLVSALGGPPAEATAAGLVKSVGEITPEGQAWRIDLALRPEGKDGPLVRSVDSYLEYYRRWAKPWEFQALLKARPVAGDLGLGERIIAEARAIAFAHRPSAAALGEIRHLKARMEKERIPRGADARRHIKMGPGCMSDIEFAAQLLQLEHGPDSDGLSVTGTLEALEAASAARLFPAGAAAQLAHAYRFLSRLRNRLFFMTGRPVDSLPNKPEDLEALGVAMGLTDQPRQELEESYLRTTRRTRRIAERLIYG